MAKHAYVLGTEAYVDSYVWECPMFQKYWWWANQMTLSDGKKHLGAPLTVIKRSMNVPPQTLMSWSGLELFLKSH
jgi:hypothetical protein